MRSAKVLCQLVSRTGVHCADFAAQAPASCLPLVAARTSAFSSAWAAAASTSTSSTTGTASAGSSGSATCSGMPWWAAAAAGALGAACTVSSVAADSNSTPTALRQPAEEANALPRDHKLLSLSQRKRIFLKYEKRIRDLSDLAKVFEYFSTEVRDGVRYMDARGVVRGLVPTYPPHDSTVERAGYLDGERAAVVEARATEESVFKYIDTNGDGLVSFPEFVLVVVLVSIPENDVRTVFSIVDVDGSGTIDESEFMSVMRMLEKHSGVQSRHHHRAGRTSYDDTEEGISGMIRVLFGTAEDKQTMDLKKFELFLSQLHSDLVRLEFGHYDADGDGRMFGIDLGASLVTSASIKQVDRLMDRVESMPPELARARFTLEEFAQVATLRRRLHELAVAVHFCQEVGHPITREEFLRLVQVSAGLQLAPGVVDVIMHVFAKPDGTLDGPAFVDVMKRRQRMPGHRTGIQASTEGTPDGPLVQLSQWWACVKSCWQSDDDWSRQ